MFMSGNSVKILELKEFFFAKTIMCYSLSITVQNTVPSIFFSAQEITQTRAEITNTMQRADTVNGRVPGCGGKVPEREREEWVTLVLQHLDWALSLHDDDNDAAEG